MSSVHLDDDGEPPLSDRHVRAGKRRQSKLLEVCGTLNSTAQAGSANQRILPARTRKQRLGERIHSSGALLSRHDRRNSGEQRLVRLVEVNTYSCRRTVIMIFESFISVVDCNNFNLFPFYSVPLSEYIGVNKPFTLFQETAESGMSYTAFLRDSIYRFRTLQLTTVPWICTVASIASHASAGHVNL